MAWADFLAACAQAAASFRDQSGRIRSIVITSGALAGIDPRRLLALDVEGTPKLFGDSTALLGAPAPFVPLVPAEGFSLLSLGRIGERGTFS